jgi:argininosuccinate lyase
MSTLWHGRFTRPPAPEMLAYTESLSFDRRLAADDVEGSRAHVAGLEAAGLLTAEEAAALRQALDATAAELAGERFRFTETDEDIHTAVERRVTELAGAAGAKLHTGRSRNDQTATDLRLFTRRGLRAVAAGVLELQAVLLDRAEGEELSPLPGFTHLQAAQPVSLAHHLLAHAWGLARDFDRLQDALRRADVSPLGAGALGGSSLPLQPETTATALGFAAPFAHSMDAVSDRDFVADALYALAMLAVRLSKMGEEVVLWSSDAFGFVRLDDAWSTGSSMLPQKKNPDIAELARGKAGRAIGRLAGFLATLKGLPLAYNRDLQEDKEALFDSLDQLRLALPAMTGLYGSLEFDRERMRAAADGPLLAAIDAAEALVERGRPFRHAHAEVAAVVARRWRPAATSSACYAIDWA